MPKTSTTFTRDLSHKLAKLRSQMNGIYENLEHTQGYGYAVPPSTVDTWRIVKARLDHLYNWCYEAKTSFEKIFRSDQVVDAIERLEWTLQWGVSQRVSVDDGLNDPGNLSISISGGFVPNPGESHEQKRWRRLARCHFWGHWKPSPQAEAYRAMCRLQEHTRKKRGSMANGYGKVLTEDDLWASDKVFVKHMKKVTSSTWFAVEP